MDEEQPGQCGVFAGIACSSLLQLGHREPGLSPPHSIVRPYLLRRAPTVGREGVRERRAHTPHKTSTSEFVNGGGPFMEAIAWKSLGSRGAGCTPKRHMDSNVALSVKITFPDK